MTKRQAIMFIITLLVLAQLACNDCADWIAVGSDAYCNHGTSQ